MGLIRAGYMAPSSANQQMGRNYAQLCAWSAIRGCSGSPGVPARDAPAPWIIAVVIDYGAPYINFWLPGPGGTPMHTWTLKGCICWSATSRSSSSRWGTILLLGGLLVGKELGAGIVVAAAIGFLLIVSLWWIYFVHVTETAEHRFQHEADHTRLARAGWPMPMASWSAAPSSPPSPSR